MSYAITETGNEWYTLDADESEISILDYITGISDQETAGSGAPFALAVGAGSWVVPRFVIDYLYEHGWIDTRP